MVYGLLLRALELAIAVEFVQQKLQLIVDAHARLLLDFGCGLDLLGCLG
jgi:predicted TPR repeat methyltransferase